MSKPADRDWFERNRFRIYRYVGYYRLDYPRDAQRLAMLRKTNEGKPL